MIYIRFECDKCKDNALQYCVDPQEPIELDDILDTEGWEIGLDGQRVICENCINYN